MRCFGLLITILGLLESLNAAPDRVKRQSNNAALEICQDVFNVSCDGLRTTVTPPPLKTDLTVGGQDTDCECVPYFQCNADGSRNQDGEFVIDRRFGTPCSGSVDVCCQKISMISNTTSGGMTPVPTWPVAPPPVTTSPVTPSPITPSPGTIMPVTTSPVTKRPGGTFPTNVPLIPVKPGCGNRNPGGVALRITGAGQEQAQFGEFPWMVAVLQRPVAPKTENVYTCGGSLIHPRAVLTSAHNVERKSPSTLLIRAGEWDSQTVLEPIPHQEIEVESIAMHPQFNTKNLRHDFAILILKKPVEITSSVNVICLPEETDVFDAKKCTATGWGADKFGSNSALQVVLKKVDLPVVPHDPCQIFLRKTRLGPAFILDRSFICAGGELGLDTCTGDGGSPLACPLPNKPDRYVQAGIVSWGIECGSNQTPGVYANVAKVRKWIDSTMAEYNLDISSYSA